MAALFESGRIVELILGLMLVEALVLIAWARFRVRRRDDSGPSLPLIGLLLNLVAGAGLLLALRAVLAGDDWRVAAAWLALAGIAHVGELARRLRS